MILDTWTDYHDVE